MNVNDIFKALADPTRRTIFDKLAVGSMNASALREGLPLRQSDWAAYLNWAVDAFKLNAAVARDDTQIHTHMCYCEFNDIMDSIAADRKSVV